MSQEETISKKWFFIALGAMGLVIITLVIFLFIERGENAQNRKEKIALEKENIKISNEKIRIENAYQDSLHNAMLLTQKEINALEKKYQDQIAGMKKEKKHHDKKVREINDANLVELCAIRSKQHRQP
jgi:uncharacterized membrane protein YhiD involved in acid resistance